MSTDDLAFKYAPVLVYHPKEKFFVYDVKEWMKNTSEITHPSGRTARKGNPGLNPKTVAKFAPEAPALYSIARYDTGEVKTLVFYIFYAYNGSKRITGNAPTGAHTADLEMIMIEFTKAGEVAFVGLSSHGDLHIYNVLCGYENVVTTRARDEGSVLVNHKRVLAFEGTHPIVYTAVNSHALYHRPGSFVRFKGFGNDVTGEGCRVRIVPAHVSTAPDVMAYTGLLGDDGVDDYASRVDPAGRPELYSKAVGHFRRIPNAVSWLGYLAYFVIPAIVYLCMRKSRGKLKFIVPAIVFVAQFYVLKVVLYYAGPKFEFPPDADSMSRWLFPLRFF